MPADTDYPLLNIFWTMLLVFVMFAWIILVVGIAIDALRRHDLSGWAKAAWVALIVFLPFVGVLAYLITQSRGMSERAIADRMRYDSYTVPSSVYDPTDPGAL